MPKEEPENDLCRCCHSEGTYKNLYESYSWLDADEVVYSKLLQECLNIEIAQVRQPLQKMLSSICEDCIEKLQDAVKFRRQVQKCETRFREVYGSCVGEEPTFEVKIKQEKLTDDETKEDTSNTLNPLNGVIANTSTIADSFRMLDDDDDDDGLSDRDDGLPYKDSTVKVKTEVEDSDSEDDVFLNEIKTTKSKTKPAPAKKKAKVTRSSTNKPESDDDEDEGLEVVQEKNVPKRKKKKSAQAVMDSDGQSDDEALVSLEGMSVIQVKNRTLRQNIDYKKTDAGVQCLRCPLVSNQSAVSVHIKTVHLNTGRYKCPICFKFFWILRELRKHYYYVHDIDNTYKCKACDKFFFTVLQLKNHEAGFHMLGEKKTCKECGFITYLENTYKKHMVCHSNERKHQCQYCQKTFKRHSTLNFHVRIHTGEKRKVCTVCGLAFVQRASLKYHMIKHHPGVIF